jgi:hypothetical protein
VAGCGIPEVQLMVRTGSACPRALCERLGDAVRDTVVPGGLLDAERRAQLRGGAGPAAQTRGSVTPPGQS